MMQNTVPWTPAQFGTRILMKLPTNVSTEFLGVQPTVRKFRNFLFKINENRRK
jgi:hypothetical protein